MKERIIVNLGGKNFALITTMNIVNYFCDHQDCLNTILILFSSFFLKESTGYESSVRKKHYHFGAFRSINFGV